MRLQDKGNRFIIVDKQTDCEKDNDQIERSSFLKIDYDPTTLHINKVKEWTIKWISRNEISKEWAKYIAIKMLSQKKAVHYIQPINQLTQYAF